MEPNTQKEKSRSKSRSRSCDKNQMRSHSKEKGKKDSQKWNKKDKNTHEKKDAGDLDQGMVTYMSQSKLQGNELNIKSVEFETYSIPIHNQESNNEDSNLDFFCFDLPNDAFSNQEFKIQLIKEDEMPTPNPDFDLNKELIDYKNKITPFVKLWESKVKAMISNYELVEIYMKDYSRKYDQSIVNFYPREEYRLSPVFSRAYFKLWEILSSTKILDKYKGKPIKFANIAEGPGGFIQCLIDFRNMQNIENADGYKGKRIWNQDKYNSVTLKINENTTKSLDWGFYKTKKYLEDINHLYRINLTYAGKTGNLLYKETIKKFREECFGNDKQYCDFATGDGGIHLEGDDQYALQELYNVKLFFAEIITAFAVLKKGGDFILKIYDIIFDISSDLIIILTQYFSNVKILKPLTSRPASSERYLVCESFNGISEEMLNELYNVLEDWVNTEAEIDYIKNKKFVTRLLNFTKSENSKYEISLKKSNELSIQSQINKIKEGLAIIEKHPETIPQDLVWKRKRLQKDLARSWCKKNRIPHI